MEWAEIGVFENSTDAHLQYSKKLHLRETLLDHAGVSSVDSLCLPYD